MCFSLAPEVDLAARKVLHGEIFEMAYWQVCPCLVHVPLIIPISTLAVTSTLSVNGKMKA